METKGYLIVASRYINFYQSGMMLMESIKDYNPDAKVCFVTEERFCDGREQIADHLLYCGNGKREKLWALTRTPFDITMYLDADMECVHEDISKIFDELGDHDLMFTDLPEHRSEIFNDWGFGDKGQYHFNLCGAVCLYDIRKPKVKEFLEEWYQLYLDCHDLNWWPKNENGEHDYINYPKGFRLWDQFPLWWLTEKEDKYKDLNIGVFEDGLRWNYWLRLEEIEYPVNPIVLRHMSAMMKKTKLFTFREIE
jgi:hypothetical protein